MERSRWLPITWMAVLAVLVLIGGMASSAWAATIWMDDFERAASNTVGNDWVEVQKHGNDVRLISITDSLTSTTSTRLQLKDHIPNGSVSAAAIQNISTTGYTDVMLSYIWAAHSSSDPDDFLKVDVLRSGGTWDLLATHSLDDNGTAFSSNTVPVGVGAIKFRFWTHKSGRGGNEGAYIDNVRLTGYSGPTAATPEPGTLLLIGSGLVGLGVGSRRRNRR